MTNDELLRRADELLDDYVDCEFYPMGADAVIRDLAAALRKERAIAEANYKSLSDALHVEQDRTHRYHERAEQERDALRAEIDEIHATGGTSYARLNEALALLKEARWMWVDDHSNLAARIDALLEKHK